MRIRQGNDFIFLWAIERNGEPEDFSNAVNIRLHFKNFDSVGEVKSFQIIDGNIVRVEVSPEWASNLGAYRLILSYEFEDQSYSDGDQKCVVDVLAFNIVPKTSEADDITEMAKTTDIMIGLNGLSAYEVWLKDNPESTKEDYYNWLRQPATDAAESIGELEQTIEGNEALRVTAEQGRSDAELLRVEAEGIRDENEIDRIEAEGIRDANETARINAESDRVDAEDLRNQAEVAREEAEELRQTNTNTAIQNAEEATIAANTAAGDANDAADAANTAAGLADTARTELTTAVNTKLDEADGKIEEMDETLSTYDGRVTQVESDIDQLESDVEQLAYVKIKNEAVNGNFENGLIAPFSRADGHGGESTLAINSSTPISGNYDIRLTITTPAGGTYRHRPIFRGLHGAANIGDKIYLCFDAKILSGTPSIYSIQNGETDYITYGGDVVNGRNTRIIDVAGTGDELGLIYFRTLSVWDMQMDNFMRINLTKTFGAGNEPTKEEMNLLLDIAGISYIDDEVIIPAQKIMQWQLKLIRKNKNAIIALGGTII